ncbi:MAG: pyridoxamine 5'-phosphate oxidase family protein [Oscillospiraceae bacterium]|nr:pyridoxamine 5'-phosphate oxidase family protein [Oscillospiraceae bacterium]
MFDYGKMRKGDREITAFNEILDVLQRANTIRLGVNGDPYPYVVPLSFGYEALGGEAGAGVAIYIHGAATGLKHELIARDNHICVEADIFHRNVKYDAGESSSITVEYESFIGFGTAEIVKGEEAKKGVDLMLEHYGYEGFEFNKNAFDVMNVYKLTLTQIKGKRNFVSDAFHLSQ